MSARGSPGFMIPKAWKVFDDWVAPPAAPPEKPSWAAVDDLMNAFSGVIEIRHRELSELLNVWDQCFSDFGGDPTHTNWSRFRPLRLSREEDWSDWLAYLIQGSATGVFSERLFGNRESNLAAYANPTWVEREVSYRGCRADLIIRWSNGEMGHIEVKVGDESLSKTFSTAAAMRAKYSQDKSQWHNYVLLLSDQVSAWQALDHVDVGETEFCVLTWDDVCVALRRALRAGEDRLWEAWAFGFVGSIEQLLIGYPGYRTRRRPLEGLGAKVRILKEGLADGTED
jgi:hypothetical protein